MRLAIGAIIKNEAPYLREWIAYHRAVGFDSFIIAENESSDDTAEILRDLAPAGVTWFRVRGRAQQLRAYKRILSRYCGKIDWIALIDADEFILPTDGACSVRPAIEEIAAAPSNGAILLNWATFGSSGHQKAGADGVLRRFTRRAEREAPVNRHLKTIVRVAAFRRMRNPHEAELRQGFHAALPSGEPLVRESPDSVGLSDGPATWKRLRVNHYVVKSREEFERKRARGRADRTTGFEDHFFEAHDQNDVVDPVPAELLEAADEQIRILAASSGSTPRRLFGGWPFR